MVLLFLYREQECTTIVTLALDIVTVVVHKAVGSQVLTLQKQRQVCRLPLQSTVSA